MTSAFFYVIVSYILNGYIDGVKVAELDLDDTNSYGPETVTLTVDASVLSNGGFFRYLFHDCTNGRNYGSSSKSIIEFRCSCKSIYE